MRIPIVIACGLATNAFADPKSLTRFDTSKVEALFDRGTKHYNLAEWDAAIASFKQAYALMPDPSFLFNLGQAYRQKGSCREATDTYKSYLRNANEDRQKVEQFIRELEPCTKLEMQRAGTARAAGWPRSVRWAGYGTLGIGGVLLGTGLSFTIRARGAEKDFERACATGCEAGSMLDVIEQRGHEASRNAKIFYVAGGATALLGAAMVVYGYRVGERLRLAPTAGGAIATTGGTFW
jgi:tetratricopeptide (TPR) repeat protein